VRSKGIHDNQAPNMRVIPKRINYLSHPCRWSWFTPRTDENIRF